MEMFLYGLGNCFVNFAAYQPLMKYWDFKRRQKLQSEAKAPALLVSDSIYLIFIGSILRVYWSISPPTMWSLESDPIQWLSVFDVVFTPILWAYMSFTVARNQDSPYHVNYYAARTTIPPWYCKAPGLFLIALCFGVLGMMVLPALDMEESFYFADVAVVAHMSVDGLAMVPQMWSVFNNQLGPRNGNTKRDRVLSKVDEMTEGKNVVDVNGNSVKKHRVNRMEKHGIEWNKEWNKQTTKMDHDYVSPSMGGLSGMDPDYAREGSHLVGILCCARLLRMTFWLCYLFRQFLDDELSGSHFVWTFLVPDMVHTLIMGDYLYVWLKKVKSDNLDPLLMY